MVWLTRRGWATLGTVVVCVAMGISFGWRSLLAVVVPLVLSVLAALIAVWRTDRPTVHRVVPEDGFVGEERTVQLEFDTDKPLAGTVEDGHGEGLSVWDNPVETTIGPDPVTYGIRYEERGVHELGPVEASVTDILGLATRTFAYADRDSVLAYPRVYDLSGATRSELAMLAGSALDREREEFDRLREYDSGDSLRDVHWKSSAKRPQQELVVKEFVAEDDAGDVLLSVETDEASADATAEAAASLAVHFLSMGVAVGLRLPGGVSLAPDAGADHRTRLLERLARARPGELAPTEREAGDVHVRGRDGGVAVRVDGSETTFEALAGLRPGDDRDDAGTGDGAEVPTPEVAP